MTGAYVFRIVICKLVYCQELSSIILLEINKNIKICFYNAILLLDLAINLRNKVG